MELTGARAWRAQIETRVAGARARRAFAFPLSLAAALAVGGSSRLGRAAEPLSVTASLETGSAEVGDVVTLNVRVVSRINGSVEVELGTTDGLSVLSQSRSESTAISWSSNRGQSLTREVGVRIELEVERAGTLVIEPVTARVGRTSAKSSPLKLRVALGRAPSSPARSGAMTAPDANEAPLFIRYRVDGDQAFVGEQILLHLEIFARPGLNFGLEDRAPAPPELDGFWREIVFQPQRLTRRDERIQGRPYHAYTVWSVALFPLSAGARTIEPVRMTFVRNRSIFDAGQRLRRRTRPRMLSIDPLPTEGRPADFVNTNVGDYTLSARVDADRVQANKAVLLTLELRGAGNISATKLPEVTALDGFRVFPPTLEDEVQRGPGGVQGAKRAEILLMPTRGGRLEIPSFSMSIFDPLAKAYRRLSTSALRIAVDGNITAQAPGSSGPSDSAGPPEAAALSLAPIRFGSDLGAPGGPHATTPWTEPWFVAGLALPWAVFVAVWGSERLRIAVRRQTPARRRRSTARRARGRLKEAREAAQAGRLADAYSAFLEAVLSLGTEKLGVNLNGQTTEQIQAALVDRGAPISLVSPLAEELQTADFARFAPGGLEDRNPDKVLERWEHIFAALEGFEPKEVP